MIIKNIGTWLVITLDFLYFIVLIVFFSFKSTASVPETVTTRLSQESLAAYQGIVSAILVLHVIVISSEATL